MIDFLIGLLIVFSIAIAFLAFFGALVFVFHLIESMEDDGFFDDLAEKIENRILKRENKDIPFPLFRCRCGKCLKVTPWFFHRWQARLCYKIGFVRYKR